MGLVNHQWASIARDNHLWRILYFNRWPSLISNFMCGPHKVSTNSETSSKLHESEEDWRKSYSLRQMCGGNWKKKNILHSTSIEAELCQQGALCILPGCHSVASAHVKLKVIDIFSGKWQLFIFISLDR